MVHGGTHRTIDMDVHTEKADTDDKKKFLQNIMSTTLDEPKMSKWMEQVATMATGRPLDIKDVVSVAVTDEAMTLLQECHDGYTRVTLAIKKMGVEIHG